MGSVMRFLVLGIAFSIGIDSPASAGAPMATITACDQVEIGGQTYPRFTFEFRNTADSACA